MEHFERVHIDSSPDVHLFVLNREFDLIDCDRLPPVVVGVEQVFGTMILVREVTGINERFDASERQPGVIQKASEDTLLCRRFLGGKYFFLPYLL